MHIGFLTPEFPHAKTGNSAGIGSSILNLSQGLVALGHKVSVIVYGQKQDERIDENGISLHLVKNRKFKGISLFLTQKKIQKLLNHLVRTEALDVVEAPDWTGITSNIAPICPIVVKLHGSDTYFCHLDQRPVKPVNRAREKKALERADAIVSVSQFTADVTKKLFDLDRAISVIPNGIDVAKFKPSDKGEITGNVLYFGTLIRKKGLLELPHIFNTLIGFHPKAKLVLVGKDSGDVKTGAPSTWNLMQPLFTEKALANVEYVGVVPYSEMRQKIETAQVCVFPTFAEALPVSWMEAMAMEKAIVASDIGWAKEIISNHKDGFLVHPTNHEAFAKSIAELLSDSQKRISFGKNARNKVLSEFSTTTVAKKSEEFYRTVSK